MLSKKAVMLLRHLKTADDWLYLNRIQKEFRGFDFRALRSLRDGGYIEYCEDHDSPPDWDEYGDLVYPQMFRISDRGLAYLEGVSHNRWVEFRSWLAIVISVLALLVSIWSATRQPQPVNVYLGSTENSTNAATTSAVSDTTSGSSG